MKRLIFGGSQKYELCGPFHKNTYFLITPQNQTTLLRKQISKVTLRRLSRMCSLVSYKIFFGVELSFFLKVGRSYFEQIARFL